LRRRHGVTAFHLCVSLSDARLIMLQHQPARFIDRLEKSAASGGRFG